MTDESQIGESTTRGAVPDGYRAAMDELDAILAEVEDDEVDVDVLAARVARAAELIEWCRERIVAARAAVDDAADRLSAD